MASLREFGRRMELRGKGFARNVDQLVRKVALAADQAVVLGTPVDTGRARSNWIVQLGTSASTTIEAYAPGGGGSTAGQNVRSALAQGESVISGYVGGRGLAIHITNNLPYIQRLNDGWSAQAPAGFVETAIVRAVRLIGRGRLTVTF